MPATNKRFGVSRGVFSRKVLWEFGSLSPVRTLAFPRPNAKPPTVVGKAAEVRTSDRTVNPNTYRQRCKTLAKPKSGI